MHEGQVTVPAEDVAAALAAQLPHLHRPDVRRLGSAGTVVAPYRIGADLLARVPLVPRLGDAAADLLVAERRHAEELGSRLDLDVARLLGVGEPFEGYPGVWSVWTWVEGESLDLLLDRGADVDLDMLAHDLTEVLLTHRSLPGGQAWTGNGRGGAPLADSDWVRRSIRRCRHLLDADAATRVWETALAAPPHAGPPVRINADPMPGNLLVRGGRLRGLVDIGAPVVGDPASDLQPAWEIFDEPQRSAFRDAMGLDDAAWARGRGWAFEMAIGGLHYYERSNPLFSRIARRTLDRLLATA